MKTIKIVISLAICSLIMLSCSESIVEETTYRPDIESLDVNSANQEFAKILAKAIQSEEIREFIKIKSLEQVDKDYDVIYHLVKNDKLKSGKTFRESLSSYCSNNIGELDKITSYDQRLTILVPYYDSLRNAEKWDVNNDISSKIILRDHNISRDIKELKCFDAKGNTSKIKRHGIPDEYMLVVKSNERLISHDNTNRLKNTENVGKSLENEDGVFAYFMDEEFDNTKKKAKSFFLAQEFLDRSEKLLYPYWNNIEYPREYIYYGIDPNKINQGSFRTDYAEHLVTLQFNSANSYRLVVEAQDITDGSLEFFIDFIFCRRDGNAFNLRKVIHAPIDSFFQLDSNNKPNIITYFSHPPLEIFSWDLYQYGDTYKIAISEYDDGRQNVTTHTNTSTFVTDTGVEGGFDILGIIKFGGKAGGSHTTTKTETITTTSTDNTDILGETFVNFFDKPITGPPLTFAVFIFPVQFYPNQKAEFDDFTKKMGSFTFASPKMYNTGTMTIGMAPFKKK